MNRRTKVLAALFLFVALLIGWPVGSHYRAQWRLSHFRRELRVRGEELEVFEVNYRLGFNVLLGHLTRLKSTAQFLSAATLLDLHEDRFAEAWENLLALNRIVARFKDEPLMISELVRLAIGNIALNTSWEAL